MRPMSSEAIEEAVTFARSPLRSGAVLVQAQAPSSHNLKHCSYTARRSSSITRLRPETAVSISSKVL